MKKTLISLSMFSVLTFEAIEVFAQTIPTGSGSGITIGTGSFALGPSIAIGYGSNANSGWIEGGHDNPESNVAIGAHAEAKSYFGIALGWDSLADRPGGIEGSQITYETNTGEKKTGGAWMSRRGALSIGRVQPGTCDTRQITGLAAGKEDTDAVNVAQLRDLQEYAVYKLNAAQENFNSQFTVMGERVGVLETSMEALKDGFTIRPKNGYQEIRVRQGDVTMGGNRIQDVGDAVAATDAVNKRQLDSTARSLHKKINDVDKDMKAGVAMALAVAGLPQAYIPGKSMLAMSAGTYQGQSGFALGLSHATENRAWIVKGSATVDTRGNFGGSLGAGYQF